MTSPDPLRRDVENLLDSQIQGVLATLDRDRPYTSLMAFAHTPDLRSIAMATYRLTRKYANLLANPRVSFLIDNRSNHPADYRDAVAISACGSASEVSGPLQSRLSGIFLNRHPQLREFITSPDCALFRIDVESYFVIRRFQEVVELRV
jgi:hypothetical protein